jgi:hypothetical protein
MFGVKRKKIYFHDYGDLLQQRSGNMRFAELAVQVATVAVEFSGKPRL